MKNQSLRNFAKRYAELVASPAQVQRRALWTAHNSLDFQKPLIYMRAIPYGEFFDMSVVQSEEPLLRGIETHLAQAVLYQQLLDDDFTYAPYVTINAVNKNPAHLRWGLPAALGEKPMQGGAAMYEPSLVDDEDIAKLIPAPDVIDEEATERDRLLIADAIGDILDVHVCRQHTLARMWNMDLSADLAKLRGLETMMWDVYDNPDFLHRVLTIMQKAVLAAIDATEAAGNYTLAEHQNQAMPYSRELAPPDCNVKGVKAADLWGYCAAQEFTAVGLDQFTEFMLDYQKPILERFGLSAYGCCEDLTRKIPALRSIRNLRRIAVSPFANVRSCAEQIGKDYILSYRPDPSSMISRGLDEDFVRKTMRDAFAAFKDNGCMFDITLKDVETILGKPDNMIRWVQIVREEIDRCY